MFGQRDAGCDTIKLDPFESREQGKVDPAVTVGGTKLDFNNTVRVFEIHLPGNGKPHNPNNERRDGVGEGVYLTEAGEGFDDHRVDVGEVVQDGAGRVREHVGVDLEGESRLVAALRDEGERLDCVDVRDEEEDVGEVDGLETDGHSDVVRTVFRFLSGV